MEAAERGHDPDTLVRQVTGRVRDQDLVVSERTVAEVFDHLAGPDGLTAQASTYARQDVLAAVGGQLAGTLIAPDGDLPQFLQRAARTDNPRDLFARLKFNADQVEHAIFLREQRLRAPARVASSGTVERTWAVPGLQPLPPADLSLQRVEAIFITAYVTFVAGHEVGHIYLGHTGARELASPFLAIPSQISPGHADEIAADTVGMASVWDGMSHNDEFGASIDYTWLVPVIFVASRAGRSATVRDPDDARSIDDWTGWILRLQLMLKWLIVNLTKNNFEIHRIMPILLSAPPLAGAVYEWVRIGVLTQGGASADQFDSTAYETLKRECDRLRSELDISR
jgi:hypothetical protein